MNYELKIENSSDPNGYIDLQRLSEIYEQMRKVSEGALLIRLRGVSSHKGRKPASYEKALTIMLCGLHKGSTILSLESSPFSETLDSIQLDAFRHEEQTELLEMTPVTLFVKTYQDAMHISDSSRYLDKSLLKNLAGFQNLFRSDDEIISISNKGSFTKTVIKKSDVQKIKSIETGMPDPKSVIITGMLDTLQYSRLRVELKTKDGKIEGYLNDKITSEDLTHFWGRNVVLQGIQHYRANNKFIVEVERIELSDGADEYFGNKQGYENIEQQISRQLQSHGYRNRLHEIIGKWPGDEDFEALAGMLTK